MAPELFSSGVRPSHSALSALDVYALGVMLNEVLTGLAPWAGVAPGVVRISVKAGNRPKTWAERGDIAGMAVHPCPELHEELLAELPRLVEDCWHQDPSRRPSAREVAQRLEALLPLVPGVARAAAVTGGPGSRPLRSPEEEAMVRGVADFLRSLCGDLTPARARDAAEAAAAHGITSAARLQTAWGEAPAGGLGMLKEQLSLGEHDAREVSVALAQRAEEEARQRVERAGTEAALQAMVGFLRGACADLTAEEARTAAESANAQRVRTVGKLRRRWRAKEQDAVGAGVRDLVELLGVDEEDAAEIGGVLSEGPSA